MSRIGRLPISVPAGVDVTIDGRAVTVKGPKGTLQPRRGRARSRSRSPRRAPSRSSRPNDERAVALAARPDPHAHRQHGHGVTEGYEKKLEIVGTGYRVVAKGSDLEFALGYSHPVTVKAPEGITFAVESPTKFSVAGHRQAAGRRGCRQHSQAAQARPVQGQGRALRRRSQSAARSERLVSKPWRSINKTRTGKSKSARAVAVTCGSARSIAGTRCVRAWSSTRSSRHVFVQVVDDTKGRTVASRLDHGSRPACVRR